MLIDEEKRRFIPWRLFIIAVLLLLAPLAVRADLVKPALIEINVFSDGHYRVEIRASSEALLTGINAKYKDTTQAPTAKEYDRLRKLRAPGLLAAFEPFRARMLDAIELRFDERQVIGRITQIEIPEPGYTKVPRISLVAIEGEVPEGAKAVTFYYPAAFGDSAIRVRQVDEASEQWHWSTWQWIRDDSVTKPYSLTEVFSPPTFIDVMVEYVVAGYEHIIPAGLDHILFVLGLFLFSTRMRPLLWQVTMFTIAHSITLALAMTGVVELPARVVEPLIALSIAYVGIENVWHRTLHKSRLALVFGFGLLHGMSFASMLTAFGMPDDAFATALIAFNVGVEFGQITVIACAFLAVGLLFGRKPYYRERVVLPGSLIIGVIGLYWAWERLSL